MTTVDVTSDPFVSNYVEILPVSTVLLDTVGMLMMTKNAIYYFVAQLVRALYRHCRGHGFVGSPEFFRFMRQLLKLSSKCEDHIFI